MKEFFIFTFSLVWFILSGVFAALIANYLELPNSWGIYLSLALLIAFAPIPFILKLKKNIQKEKKESF